MGGSIKSFGIIFSYIWLVVAAYVFDWEPINIFLTFFFEVLALLLVYYVVRVIDERQNPKKYRKLQPAFSILMAAVPFLFVQYLFIHFTAKATAPITFGGDQNSLLHSYETYLCLGFILLMYILRAINLENMHQRETVFRDNFLFQIVSLALTNVVGMLVVIYSSDSLLIVLIIMSIARIFLELSLGRNIKLL
jgi:hypothetical protein